MPLLKNAGAAEVHMGVDLARREEPIAARMDVPGIGRHIGADSIGYLSLEGLLRAIDSPADGSRTGCLTGRDPVPVQMEMDKLVLDRV